MQRRVRRQCKFESVNTRHTPFIMASIDKLPDKVLLDLCGPGEPRLLARSSRLKGRPLLLQSFGEEPVNFDAMLVAPGVGDLTAVSSALLTR